jgi:hypothetical protein
MSYDTFLEDEPQLLVSHNHEGKQLVFYTVLYSMCIL